MGRERLGIGADAIAENPHPALVANPDVARHPGGDDDRNRQEDTMSKTVVLGLDGSQDSTRAIPYAVEQAGSGGKIVVIHVRELLIGRAGGMPLVANEDEIEAGVRRQVEDMNADDVSAELQVISAVAGGPAHVIADAAAKERADVIVVGTRGHRQIASMFIGGVTHRLLHLAQCPVLAVPPASAGSGSESADTEAFAARA
jgi:nucleotide-binding universal stress UspA family protein